MTISRILRRQEVLDVELHRILSQFYDIFTSKFDPVSTKTTQGKSILAASNMGQTILQIQGQFCVQFNILVPMYY